MSKPLKETFASRVWRLLVGVLFYNTVYWKRASDGLQPPKLTRDERLQARPKRDLAKIRPRSHPRARLDAQESAGADVSVPRLGEATPKPAITAAEPPPPEPETRKRIRRKKRQVRLKSGGFISRWFN